MNDREALCVDQGNEEISLFLEEECEMAYYEF